MKSPVSRLARGLATIAVLTILHPAVAETLISTFDDFNLDGLFAWSDATINSGPTSYSVTDSGYGSGYKDINPNIDATGETNIELTVTLDAAAGPGTAISGPIVSLVDADGTMVNYAWYGQTKGRKVLTAVLRAPTSVSNPGTVPGLDLSTLDFFHLQNDPGGYSGTYTITFENLRLTGAPRPVITSHVYNPATRDLTLTWSSLPGRIYSILHTVNFSNPFSPLAADIPADSTTTTTTVTLPAEDIGFVEIQQQ